MLLAAIDLLRQVGDPDTAARIQDAWKATLADGLHTADIYRAGSSTRKLGTQAFADAVIERLAEPDPTAAEQPSWPKVEVSWKQTARPRKTLVGVDVFVDWNEDGRDPHRLGERVQAFSAGHSLNLALITNRGVKVYPEGLPETRCTDHWRCRFRSPDNQTITHEAIIELLSRFSDAGLDFIKTEHLYLFDGQPGFSLAQGE